MELERKILSTRRSDAVATMCAVFMLIGAAKSRLERPDPHQAEPYHARVRTVAHEIPISSGDWSGLDVPVPATAVDQLRPNILISRQLRNVVDGTTVGLLLVQSRDVRDLAPHYPPVCYPGQGLTLTKQEPIVLQVDNLQIPATRYTFESNSFQADGALQVDDFMILPDGRFQPDMKGMDRRIGADQRYFGAAQIQLVHRGSSSNRANRCIGSYSSNIQTARGRDRV
jgi:hypothetical protein